MLLQHLDYFLNNESEYKRLGIPYTAGYLFYGPPGNGKTSTIKAIANKTKRHILNVELTTIRSVSDLYDIFLRKKNS